MKNLKKSELKKIFKILLENDFFNDYAEVDEKYDYCLSLYCRLTRPDRDYIDSLYAKLNVR